MSEDLKRKTRLLVHSSELFIGYCLLKWLKAKHTCRVSVLFIVIVQYNKKIHNNNNESGGTEHCGLKRAPATDSCDTKNITKHYIIFMMDEN